MVFAHDRIARSAAALAAALTLALGAAACGDSDDGGDSAAAPPAAKTQTEAEDYSKYPSDRAPRLMAAYHKLRRAFEAGNAKAVCADLDSGFHETLREGGVPGNPTCVEYVREQMEIVDREPEPRPEILYTRVYGDVASITVREGDEEPYRVEFWKNDGEWRCDADFQLHPRTLTARPESS